VLPDEQHKHKPDDDPVLSLNEFGERNLLGRSSVYREITSGRLIAHKFGKRVGIFSSEEARWRSERPRVESHANHWRRKHPIRSSTPTNAAAGHGSRRIAS
jgi:hypothetical protein